ncbi:MAG: recombinase family protein [Oscillospiraceae bacterium]|nr:recombinase family protein [Oscillospiraceae bacterium]
MDFTPFKNLVNDMYVQDISKKIRSAMMTKKRQGKFIGDTAPYGYEKDPADKNHLIVNEKYAPTVRRIFQMAKDGLSLKRIAAILTEEKIRRPGAVAGDNHAEFRKYVGNGDEYHWHGATVRGILRNPTYTGSVIGNKSVKLAFRSKKRRRCSDDEIIIVDGMHEPTIEPEEWELVQSLITSRKRGTSDRFEKFDNIFCGLLFCPECGHSLGMRHSNRKWDNENYYANYDFYCNTYNNYGPTKCSTHRITASALYDAIWEDIQMLAEQAICDDDKMITSIAAKLSEAETDGVKQAERELKKTQKRLAELDRLFAKLYEEHVNEEIDERNYKRLSATYIKEQRQLETKISELNGIINANRENNENAEMFVETIKAYAEIDKLTQAMLHRLIDRIEVHEPEDMDGEYIQKLDVYYKLVGRID